MMKQIKYYIFFFVAISFFTDCTFKKKASEKTHIKMQRADSVNEAADQSPEVSMESLIKPSNEFVISSVPVTALQQSNEQMQVAALGTVQYDNREIGTVSSRIEGRIEKLYVRYRYQYLKRGDKILDIYSPELLTSQQNLLFVLHNDKENFPLINAAKQRLLLLGMTAQQLNQIISTGKPLYSVSVFSNYSGYVNEIGFNRNSMNENTINQAPQAMQDIQTTQELSIKEGMYLQKGQPVVTVINANRALIILNIYAEQQNLIRAGDAVKITPETAPEKLFGAKIDFIEPFFRPESKTLSARVYFNNTSLKLPIGSQVQASIFAKGVIGSWLPSSAILTLGLNQVAFKKEGDGFKAITVTTGMRNENKIQITGGLSFTDSVAVNAEYLVDKESIIKTKNQ
jgi:Cu(I)/Ag(I) efflux system membrane fusion protein